MDIVGFIRVSTEGQEVERQKVKILDYAARKKLGEVRFIEIKISTRKKKAKKIYSDLIESLESGKDMIIVSDLVRSGKDVVNVIDNINRIVERNLAFVAVDQNINITHDQKRLDFATKALVYVTALVAELNRDMISIDTKDRLKVAKDRGVKLGRKKGSRGKSKLDGKEQEIAELLDFRVSKAAIARKMGVSATTMKHFIKTRKLEPSELLKKIT